MGSLLAHLRTIRPISKSHRTPRQRTYSDVGRKPSESRFSLETLSKGVSTITSTNLHSNKLHPFPPGSRIVHSQSSTLNPNIDYLPLEPLETFPCSAASPVQTNIENSKSASTHPTSTAPPPPSSSPENPAYPSHLHHLRRPFRQKKHNPVEINPLIL